MVGGRARRRAEKRKGRGFRRPVLEALSLPEDAAGGAVRLIALGGERVLVENHRGIAEVTAARVRLLVPGGMLAVTGERLRLADVRPGALCVTGDIARIELPGRREAGHD